MNITVPVTGSSPLLELRAGERVYLSGSILTGRDAAHKALCEMLLENRTLPISLAGQCIFYAGPCPAAPGEIIGPCGPTTSGRMDKYTPLLLKNGLKAMIGKGARSEEVLTEMHRQGAVYFGATGGAAMLIQSCVTSLKVIAFAGLGTEAIYQLEVKDMPLLVLCDAHGGNMFKK